MRLVIAEDAALLRDGLVRLLRDEGHEVLAAVGDADALVAEVGRHRPDVAIVDVRMPPTHTDEGLRAAIHLREAVPTTGVLVLSQDLQRGAAVELVAGRADGTGYLLKDRVAHVEDFLDALDRVAAGGTAFDPQVVEALLRGPDGPASLRSLSDREAEVLALMAEGRTNPAIAAMLHLSVSAIEKHVRSIFAKLDLHLEPGDAYHRRVLAILRYLEA